MWRQDGERSQLLDRDHHGGILGALAFLWCERISHSDRDLLGQRWHHGQRVDLQRLERRLDR
jgi:hypothetical protein